ncbi:MAG: UbiX family flavin prenyltransferase [Planctomycetes bacterium]|nr:UbiX family flavin prenyltransferase [Planctomycetota bacterium]
MAISGASGAPYARRLLDCLSRADAHIHLVVSPPAREVIADELGITSVGVEALLGRNAENVTLYNFRQVGAKIASGSFLTDGMVICPCSAHTLASVANGLADNLMLRAALVTLKEHRRLVLVPREMPLGAIELENMLKLTRAGAVVCPASPGFYMRPQSVDDLIDFVVGRVLDQLGIPHALRTRWNPDEHRPSRSRRDGESGDAP